jgi:thymidylate synthase
MGKYNEAGYRALVIEVLTNGETIKGRNGDTLEVFGTTLKLDVSGSKLPLITGRKMFYKGIIGEFLAFLQTDCNHTIDFESRGCNYWKLWADEDGNLEIDYPPGKQLDDIIENIKRDPHSRRHIIDLWNPQNLTNLSLPCCHYSYQFNVQGNTLNMIWTQRSADIMIGVPSDMVLATLYLRVVAQVTGYDAGEITMNFGSTHIYSEDIDYAYEYVARKHFQEPMLLIEEKNYTKLVPDDFTVLTYRHHGPIAFELKA